MRSSMFMLLTMIAALMLSGSRGYAQETDSSVAAIVNVQGRGRIWIKPKNQPQWQANPKTWLLDEGDSVKTNRQCRATVLYHNGQSVQLGPQKSHRVTTAKKASMRSKFASLLSWWLGQEKPLPQGASRGLDKPPVLLYPRYGKILAERPSFAWLASAPGASYQIQLFNANDSLLWKTTQQDTLLNYPSHAPQLIAGGSYQVAIRRQYKEATEDFGNFSIASPDEKTPMAALAKEIQAAYQSGDPTNVTVDIVHAAALMQAEFFTDAILVLQQALKKQPNNRAIRTMLAQIYDQVGPPILIEPMLE